MCLESIGARVRAQVRAMDDIESERRCDHVPRAERRGHARSGQAGQWEAELVVLCDNIREYVLV